MNALAAAITDLFLAFGAANPERVGAYTRMLTVDAPCQTCLEMVCRKAAVTSQRMPSVAALLSSYRDHYGQEHIHHLGQTDIEVTVGKLEKFWRTDATRILTRFTDGDRDLASFVAAQMWWIRVPATPEDVLQEAEDPIWVDCARRFLASWQDPYVIDKAWTRARMAATVTDDKDIPDGVVQLA